MDIASGDMSANIISKQSESLETFENEFKFILRQFNLIDKEPNADFVMKHFDIVHKAMTNIKDSFEQIRIGALEHMHEKFDEYNKNEEKLLEIFKKDPRLWIRLEKAFKNTSDFENVEYGKFQNYMMSLDSENFKTLVIKFINENNDSNVLKWILAETPSEHGKELLYYMINYHQELREELYNLTKENWLTEMLNDSPDTFLTYLQKTLSEKGNKLYGEIVRLVLSEISTDTLASYINEKFNVPKADTLDIFARNFENLVNRYSPNTVVEIDPKKYVPIEKYNETENYRKIYAVQVKEYEKIFNTINETEKDNEAFEKFQIKNDLRYEIENILYGFKCKSYEDCVIKCAEYVSEGDITKITKDRILMLILMSWAYFTKDSIRLFLYGQSDWLHQIPQVNHVRLSRFLEEMRLLCRINMPNYEMKEIFANKLRLMEGSIYPKCLASGSSRWNENQKTSILIYNAKTYKDIITALNLK